MKSGRGTWMWLVPLGAAHRGLLLGGLGFTVAAVLLRLALPWPLRGFMDVALREIGQTTAGLQSSRWSSTTPVMLALLFVVIVSLLGWVEMHQRILLKRYSTQSVHHLRGVAVAAARRRRSHDVADLVSRIIGDSARLKAEFAGILVHGSQSALYFSGIVVVFFFVSPKLAGILLLGGLYSFFVGYRGQLKVAAVARKQRERESRYAASLAFFDADSRRTQRINAESARNDVKTTRLIMRASWAVHVGFAFLTAAALLVSLHDVRDGSMQPGDLFLLIAYALTAHRRLVQVGRQLARWGKVEAHTERLVELIESTPRSQQSSADSGIGGPKSGLDSPRSDSRRTEVRLGPLTGELVLREIHVGKHSQPGQRRRLHRTDLHIPAGAKIAVVGRAQAGRTVLLRALAGRVEAQGRITWNGQHVGARDLAKSAEIRFLPHTPLFGHERLVNLLGLNSVLELEKHGELASTLGLDRIIAEARRGIETKLSSSDMSRVEARAILLFDWLRDSAASLWVLDDPVEGLGRRKAAAWIDLILSRAGRRTVVLGLSRLPPAPAFDEVHFMRKRRVAAPAL